MCAQFTQDATLFKSNYRFHRSDNHNVKDRTFGAYPHPFHFSFSTYEPASLNLPRIPRERKKLRTQIGVFKTYFSSTPY